MNAFRFLLLFLFLTGNTLYAQNVPVIEVPDEIDFAGITLRLTDEVRTSIQKDITLITRNARYFQAQVERANLYFPLIDKVFEEESLPKDFKYLALQESSLIADAVSKSNAVGYWQFKKESAIEVGLRVDSRVDERMNIIAASRGAARYLKRNNQTFDNWIYSLLSYNLGLGGTKPTIDQKYVGAKKMEIDEKMHWYVIRFLAHKLAYQHAIGNSARMDSVLVEYINGANKTFEDIALENNLDKSHIELYNKWLRTDRIPEDKIYPVVLVVPFSQAEAIARNGGTAPIKQDNKNRPEKYTSASDVVLMREVSNITYTLIINGSRAIFARQGDNPVRLSSRAGISKDDFLRYNEMRSFDQVIPGKVYYLERKRNKAKVMFHTVQYNESLWDIAQNYGIDTETIRDKNRMDEHEALEPGRVLWLRMKRPKNREVEIKPVKKPELPPVIVKEDTTAVKKEIVIKNEPSILIKLPENNTMESSSYDYSYHDVATGETIFSISRKYSIATDSIMQWNQMEGYAIKIGQRVIVGRTPKKPETVTHTVSTGETAYKIARQYGISVAELQEWNSKQDLTLKIGEKLIIKKSQTKP